VGDPHIRIPRGAPEHYVLRTNHYIRLEMKYMRRIRALVREVIEAVPVTSTVIEIDIDAICASSETGLRESEVALLTEFMRRQAKVKRIMEKLDGLERALCSLG
jgi:predicted transcriptional regulator